MLKWKKGEGEVQIEKVEEDKYWLELETPSQRKSRIRSLYIVHIAMLVFSLGFSIVLTGILPYLKRLTKLPEDNLLSLMGWMVAINPLGQMIFSPILGWLGNRLGSIRLICLVTCVLYIAGNALYASLSLFPNDPNDPESSRGAYRYSFMFLARLLVGISSANQAPIRSYIVGATWKHERNTHISILSLFQALGFMIGPAIQSALTPVGCSEEYPNGELKLDMYTISGWLSAAVGFISLCLFLPGIFSEHYVAKIEAQRLRTEDDTQAELDRPDLLAVFSCTLSFFMFLFNFILLETIGTPLCMEQLGWSEQKSITNLGILMSAGAVISMIAYGTIPILTRKIDERKVFMFFGLIPMIIGRVVMIPMGTDLPKPKHSGSENASSGRVGSAFMTMLFMTKNAASCEDADGSGGCDLDQLTWCSEIPAISEVQFYLGYIIAAISFPYCMAICQAVFSKLIGPRPQGVWMGLLTSVGSLARICGPVFVSFIYVNYGTYWTFGLCAASLGISLIATILTYKRLIPIEERLGAARDTDSTAGNYDDRKESVEGELNGGFE